MFCTARCTSWLINLVSMIEESFLLEADEIARVLYSFPEKQAINVIKSVIN